jgi:hypothetical protein
MAPVLWSDPTNSTGAGSDQHQPPREVSLGFNAPALKPGLRTRVVQRPQARFKPTRLVIGQAPGDLVVHGIQVAEVEQLLPGAAVPAAVFSPQAIRVDLDFGAAAPGQEIVLEVSSAQGGPFTAAMIGVVETPPRPEPLVEEAQKALAAIEAGELDDVDT